MSLFEKRYSPFSVIVGAVVWLTIVGVGLVLAQATPDNGAPPIPQDVQQAALTLQVQLAGLTHAQAIIQKEIDAAAAQLQRTVQQAQSVCTAVPGYELSTQPALACRPKKKDEPAKKE